MIVSPNKNECLKKATYLISGSKLANMCSPAEWIRGVNGEINIEEHADGSISVGLDNPTFAYVIVNGELRACMIPLTFIADPNA